MGDSMGEPQALQVDQFSIIFFKPMVLGWFEDPPHLKKTTRYIQIPSGNQTWPAAKSTISFDVFAIETSI
jgi:hypothetical protein